MLETYTYTASSSSKKNLIFDYDAMGNRIAKHVLTAADVLEKSTYYVLDASEEKAWFRRPSVSAGTMSMYERQVNESEGSVAFRQSEKHIYGSSRLGMMTGQVSLLGSEFGDYDMGLVDHVIGQRVYELSNRLGNVLTTISDKPIPHDEDSDHEADWFLADIRTVSDYSPFGVQLEGRSMDGCTPQTLIEEQTQKVTYQNMSYAGSAVSYVNVDGDLETYPGAHGGGSSVERIAAGEWITWNVSSVASENETFVGTYRAGQGLLLGAGFH